MTSKFYPVGSASIASANIRSEFEAFVRGDAEQPATAQIAILRRMRRKPGVYYPLREAELVLSPAVDKFSQESDLSHPNWYTEREKYYFTDEFVYTYRVNLFDYTDRERLLIFGTQTINLTFFYFEAKVMPSRFDKIIEPLTKMDGELVSPIQYKAYHEIEMAQAFRGEAGWGESGVTNSKIEYWRCAVQGEPLPGIMRKVP